MSSNRAGPVPSRIGVRSMITVTNLSPRQALPDHDQAEFVEAAERGQVRARKGSSVKHVEVFRVAGVGTSILGRPRPLHRHRRAGCYTLKSEEPSKFKD